MTKEELLEQENEILRNHLKALERHYERMQIIYDKREKWATRDAFLSPDLIMLPVAFGCVFIGYALSKVV